MVQVEPFAKVHLKALLRDFGGSLLQVRQGVARYDAKHLEQNVPKERKVTKATFAKGSIVWLFLAVLAFTCRGESYEHDFTQGKGQWNGVWRDGTLYHEMQEHHPGSYLASAAGIPVSAGEKYIFEAEIRIPVRLKQGVYRLQAVFFSRENGAVQNVTSTESVDFAPEWHRISMPLQVPGNAVSLQLRLLHNGVGRVEIRRIACRPPEEGSFDAGRFPMFANTMEEQKILHGMSLKTGGEIPPLARLDYSDRPEGSRYSVNFHWGNPEEIPHFGKIESALPDMRRPGSPRQRVSAVSLWVRVPHCRSTALALDVRFRELLSGYGDAQNQWVARIPVEALAASRQWTRIELHPGDFTVVPGNSMEPAWEQIEPSTLFFDVEGTGELVWALADVRVSYDDGDSASAFAAWEDPLWYFGRLEKALAPLPSLDGRNVHGSGIYLLESDFGRKNFLALKERVPNLAFQQYICLPELMRARDWLRENGMTAGYQGVGPFLWQRAVELDALAVPRGSYELLNERHHKMDYTDDLAWHTIWSEVAERFGKLGIPEYQTIDSNFRVSNEKVELHAPRILREEDLGIVPQQKTAASGATLHFWDYFEWYTGFRWLPGDLGWQDWEDYRVTPVNLVMNANAEPLAIRRAYLDFMLRHYAFIRWHADASAALGAQGVRYILMNNGDDWRNANDFIAATALGHLGGFVEETFFYHPQTVLKAFHQSVMMEQAYAGKDIHHRLIAESGKNGHNPIYWAPEYSYAAIFDITAAGNYSSLEIDWPSAWMHVQTLPENAYDYNRHLDYLAKCLAFNRASNDHLQTSGDLRRVFVLQETRATYAGERKRVLGSTAEEENWPVSRITPQLFQGKIRENARMVINDCYALSERDAKMLIDWVDSAPGRVLVLHGSAAGRRIDGTMWSEVFGWNPVDMNAPEQFAEFFGTLSFHDGHTWAERPGEVVFSDPDGPVLSYVRRPSGSVVWYYARTPGMDKARDARIIASLMKRHGIPPVARSEGTMLVRKYLPGGNLDSAAAGIVFTAFARKELEEYKWVYSAQDNGCYPWRLDPAREYSADVSAPPGRYRLIAMLGGKESAVTVGEDGVLPLKLEGVSAEVFYLIPESSKRRLEGIRAHRDFLKAHIVGLMQEESRPPQPAR